jgi:hypothetical protein
LSENPCCFMFSQPRCCPTACQPHTGGGECRIPARCSCTARHGWQRGAARHHLGCLDQLFEVLPFHLGHPHKISPLARDAGPGSAQLRKPSGPVVLGGQLDTRVQNVLLTVCRIHAEGANPPLPTASQEEVSIVGDTTRPVCMCACVQDDKHLAGILREPQDALGRGDGEEFNIWRFNLLRVAA